QWWHHKGHWYRWTDRGYVRDDAGHAAAVKAGATGGGRPDDRPGPHGTGGTGPAAGVVGTAMAAAQSPNAHAASFHLPGERQPYDCSAFTQAVFRLNHINIGSTTYTQYGGGRKVQKNDLQPGDLV